MCVERETSVGTESNEDWIYNLALAIGNSSNNGLQYNKMHSGLARIQIILLVLLTNPLSLYPGVWLAIEYNGTLF